MPALELAAPPGQIPAHHYSSRGTGAVSRRAGPGTRGPTARSANLGRGRGRAKLDASLSSCHLVLVMVKESFAKVGAGMILRHS